MMILQKQKLLFGGIALFLSGCLATSQKGPQADCPDGSIDNGKGQCLVASSQVQKLEKELSTSDVLTQERLKKLGLYRTEEECRKSEADELCRVFFFRETHQRIKAYNSMQPCVAGEYNWLEKRGIRTPGSSRELIFNAGDRKTDRPESDRKPEDISWPDADPERLLEANRTCKLFDPAHSGSYYANKYLNVPANEYLNAPIGCSETSKALAKAAELIGAIAELAAAISDPGSVTHEPFSWKDQLSVEPDCP